MHHHSYCHQMINYQNMRLAKKIALSFGSARFCSFRGRKRGEKSSNFRTVSSERHTEYLSSNYFHCQ